jgi:flavodoxin/NAD-dependent dihydropyrimidine dehydrogenase PreA subunit
MIRLNVAIVYFSATGNTESIAKKISNSLESKNVKTNLMNITAFNDRLKKYTFDKFDLILFGFPVYGGAIPRICIDWIKTIDGNEKWAAMFFTYGGPTMGMAHYHTKIILNEQNFRVFASAEFLGKHSYNVAKGFNFLPNRPNERDYKLAKEYAQKLYRKISSNDLKDISFERPEIADLLLPRIDDRKKSIVQQPPTRDGKDCSMCLTCEENCPTNAFNAQIGEADGEKCIACMRCVTNCPDEVIVYKRDMTDIDKGLREHFNLTDEVLSNLKGKYFFA